MIAVASGKGGVGKSSLTVNLAAALDGLGQQVGLIDADIYGHSIPHMLGVHQRPIVVDKMIVPPVRGRLKLISIGSFLDDNAPVMWRGPMLHRALEQFLSDVHWGELDTMLVDMPPGTGDMAISLGQLLPRAEVLVVTTPQPLAQEVAVARRDDGAEDGPEAARRGREHEPATPFGTGRRRQARRRARRAAARNVPLDTAPARGRRRRRARRRGRPGVGVGPRDRRDRRGRSRRRGRARSASRSPSSRRTTKGARRRPSQFVDAVPS